MPVNRLNEGAFVSTILSGRYIVACFGLLRPVALEVSTYR